MCCFGPMAAVVNATVAHRNTRDDIKTGVVSQFREQSGGNLLTLQQNHAKRTGRQGFTGEEWRTAQPALCAGS